MPQLNADVIIKMRADLNDLRRAEESLASFQGLLARVGTVGATLGIAAGFKDFIRTGVEFNATLETAQIGIAAVYRSFDKTGRYATFADAMKASAGAIADLKREAATSPATFEQLLVAYQSTAGAMASAGIPIGKQVGLINLLSQTLSGLGIRSEQLVQESRAILTGNINENAAGARMLGITRGDIESAKAAGTLLEFLNSKLSTFAEAAEAGKSSFNTLKSNLEDAYTDLAAKVSKPLFDSLKGSIASLNAGIANLSPEDFRPLIDMLKGAADAGVKLASVLPQIVNGLVALAAAYAGVKGIGMIGAGAASLSDFADSTRAASDAASVASRKELSSLGLARKQAALRDARAIESALVLDVRAARSGNAWSPSSDASQAALNARLSEAVDRRVAIENRSGESFVRTSDKMSSAMGKITAESFGITAKSLGGKMIQGAGVALQGFAAYETGYVIGEKIDQITGFSDAVASAFSSLADATESAADRINREGSDLRTALLRAVNAGDVEGAKKASERLLAFANGLDASDKGLARLATSLRSMAENQELMAKASANKAAKLVAEQEAEIRKKEQEAKASAETARAALLSIPSEDKVAEARRKADAVLAKYNLTSSTPEGAMAYAKSRLELAASGGGLVSGAEVSGAAALLNDLAPSVLNLRKALDDAAKTSEERRKQSLRLDEQIAERRLKAVSPAERLQALASQREALEKPLRDFTEKIAAEQGVAKYYGTLPTEIESAARDLWFASDEGKRNALALFENQSAIATAAREASLYDPARALEALASSRSDALTRVGGALVAGSGTVDDTARTHLEVARSQLKASERSRDLLEKIYGKDFSSTPVFSA